MGKPRAKGRAGPSVDLFSVSGRLGEVESLLMLLCFAAENPDMDRGQLAAGLSLAWSKAEDVRRDCAALLQQEVLSRAA